MSKLKKINFDKANALEINKYFKKQISTFEIESNTNDQQFISEFLKNSSFSCEVLKNDKPYLVLFKKQAKPHLTVVSAVFIDNDKILCCQRNKDSLLSLKWEFPGGKVEPFESKEDAIVREIREELMINISVLEDIVTSYHEYDTFTIELTSFLVKIKSGELKCLEHQKIGWFDYYEAMKLDFAAADIETLDRLKEYLK